MAASPWQPGWDPFREFQREVGRILGGFDSFGLRTPRLFPAVNLFDAGDRFLLTAELPGVSTDQIDLSITGDTLTLRGERRRPDDVPDDRYRRQERQFGRWVRTIPLPARVDGSKVSAQFAHGVLTVTVPKAPETQPRQISVSAV